MTDKAEKKGGGAKTKSVKEKAYAKINLFLDVTALRDDGFHSIRTVMHSLSLCDEVTVSAELGVKNIRLFIEGEQFLPTDRKNLVYRAAEAFLDKSGISASVQIKLKKRIPVSAGLAGGSTDAAATLRALNRIFNRHFTDKALLSIAEKLGSDVPYCLLGGTALCEGRGEIITRLPDTLDLIALVAIADEHVSTPEAYSLLDGMYSSFDGTVKTEGGAEYDKLLEFISGKTQKMPVLYNIFESAILPSKPKATALKERMISLGATSSLMSGSGPGVFGIFNSEEEAENAKTILESEGYRAYTARTV